MLFLVTYFAPARNEQLDQQGLAKTPPWGPGHWARALGPGPPAARPASWPASTHRLDLTQLSGKHPICNIAQNMSQCPEYVTLPQICNIAPICNNAQNMPQCPKYATMPQICHIAGGRIFDIFLIFQKCPKNAPQGPGGPGALFSAYFRLFLGPWGALGAPPGGALGGPWAPLFSLSWAAVLYEHSRGLLVRS